MARKISRQIVGYSVGKPGHSATEGQKPSNVVEMHEKLERPHELTGSTYKIKVPSSAHALYVTINDIVLNAGTEHELRRPFEIFVNSKNMDHFQWIVALTRIMSAVFRKGGDIAFLVEELHSVFDPRGGYFKGGGKFVPSLVAEIGDVLESHLKSIGMIKDDADEHQRRYLEEKRAEHASSMQAAEDIVTSDFPDAATLCMQCRTKAVIRLDGCMTCLNCGESKCD
jgi:hypothetical protein